MSTNAKVYTFYIIIILLSVVAMIVFDLNILAKGILSLIIFFCMLIMRSVQKNHASPTISEPEVFEEVELLPIDVTDAEDGMFNRNSSLELYLRLLIQADEELSKEIEDDQMSPSYNIRLNMRIAERLEAIESQRKKIERVKNNS